MKQEQPGEPRIRVIEEERSVSEVVRLGEPGGVVRLGGPPRPVAAAPRRLEIVEQPTYEVRSQEPGVEEILDPGDGEGGVPMEERWGGGGRRRPAVPWGWFVVAGALFAGLVGWSLQQLARNRGAVAAAAAQVEQVQQDELYRTAEAERLYQRLRSRVEGYLAADSVDALAGHVRQPERVVPLMREWYASRPLRAAQLERLLAFQPLTIERRPFWVVRVEVAGGSARSLLVEQTEDDDGLVDWETDVCYQPMPWEEFISRRPAGGFGFRVNAVADSFYAHEFADERQYRCFRLTVRGSEQHLFGYVRRGSRQEAEMLQATGGGPRPAPMLLELMFVPDSAALRSVMVFEVVSPRWCMVERAGG